MSAIANVSKPSSLKTQVIEWGVFGFGLVSLALAITLTVFAPDLSSTQNAQADIPSERVNL